MTRSLLTGALAALLYAGAAQASPGCEPPCPTTPSQDAATVRLLAQVKGGWLKREWRAYVQSFVAADGRVVDNANGGVSHSEGQGYAMLIATYANDAETFDRVWDWTRTRLQVRDDRLFAWRWSPAKGQVDDDNDATDGDLLIAWALARAADKFGRPPLREQAQAIAVSLGRRALIETGFGPTLAPGAAGFGRNDQPDGPIVNPSYWIFPALVEMGKLDPAHDWAAVRRSAFQVLATSRFGREQLPLDWESARDGHVEPAQNFAQTSGYDALRIPLYLSWSDDPRAKQELVRYADALAPGQSPPARFRGAGYELVNQLARCANGRGELTPDSLIPRDSLYYPATLRMLVFIVALERYPQCL